VYRGSSRGRAGRRGQQAARRMPECRAATAWRQMHGDCGGGRWPEGGGAEKKTPAGVDRELEERVYFYAQ